MSRWWAERIRLDVHSDRLVLAKVGRGRNPKTVAQAVLALPEGTPDGWHPLVARLGETLATPPWRGGELEAVLSHRWCRLALLPGGVALRDRQEELQFAQLRLNQENGDLPDNWEVTISDSSPAAPRIACAAERELLEALDAAASSGRTRIVSIQPFFAAVYNQNRYLLNFAHFWLCTIEGQRICLVRIQGKFWQSLRVARVFGHPGDSLARLLDHETLLGASTQLPLNVVVCAPDSPEITLPAGSPWQLTYISIQAGAANSSVRNTMENQS